MTDAQWQQDREQWWIDRADDHVDRDEWAELHGEHRDHRSMREAIAEAGHAKRRAMTGVAGIIEEEMADD